MHRSSLRVIIPVPEVGMRTRRGGRYSERMGTHERLVHGPEGAVVGEIVSVATFWSGALAVRWVALPEATGLDRRFSRLQAYFRAVVPTLQRTGPAALARRAIRVA